MKLLALETSTDACSVALWLDGQLLEHFEVQPRGHGKLILAMVDNILHEAGLPLNAVDALAFGRGPGAFTGLRVAAGVVQGLAYAVDRPVVAVSSLAALAQGVDGERVLAMQDARMGEIYLGMYWRDPGGLVLPWLVDRLCKPGLFLQPLPHPGPWTVVGSAWSTYHEALALALSGCDLVHRFDAIYPRAGDVARLAVAGWERGEGVGPDQALPVYLRDEVVQLPKGQKPV